MRAAFLTAAETFEIREIPQPTPGPHEVLLRVDAVGLCGTDFHIYSGEANYNFGPDGTPIPLAQQPQLMGHEYNGTVIATGSEVNDIAKGTRMCVDQGITCVSRHVTETCEYCQTGDSHQCEHYREQGIVGLHGAFAEFITVAARNCVPILSDISAAHAAMVEPIACVLHSTDMMQKASTRYSLTPGDGDLPVRSLLLCGAGPSGLMFVQVLRKVIGYDGQLLVADYDPKKRELATRFGATAFDPRERGIVPMVNEYTDGRRVECLIDATGSGPLFLDIPALIRSQATFVLYGHGHGGVGLEALNNVQFREPHMISPVGASGDCDPEGYPQVYKRALDLLEAGTIEVDDIVTHQFDSLDSIPEAFSGIAREPGYVKGVVTL